MSANATPLNSFSTRLCLSQLSRGDRWKQADDEFKRVGLVVDRFLAYPGDSGWQSFNRSQKAMIEEMLKANAPGITFEDDAIFKECDHLQDALNELPPGWDILYLGANLLEEKPKRHSKNLFRVTAAWTTHAIAYTPLVMKYIVDNYDPDENGMYDDWLNKNVLSRFSAYITSPMVCWQRPGYSDLWGRATDYMPCFENGNAKMAAL